MNRPPIKVTAHSGMDDQKSQDSIAVTISVGNMVGAGEEKPVAPMILEITPWTISMSATMSSNP